MRLEYPGDVLLVTPKGIYSQAHEVMAYCSYWRRKAAKLGSPSNPYTLLGLVACGYYHPMLRAVMWVPVSVGYLRGRLKESFTWSYRLRAAVGALLL